MFKYLFSLICLFISVSITAETVYKNIDADGSVSFTDKKSVDSKEIKVRKPISYSPVPLPALSLPTKKLSPTFDYKIQIIQPAKDSNIINRSDVMVSIVMSPPLKKGYGHQIHYQLADQSIKSTNTSVTFNNVFRGSHDIRINIIDKSGEVVSPVTTSRFYVKRFFKKPAVAKPKPKS